MTSSPQHANTLYNYAVMLDTHCDRKEEAEGLYRQALSFEPNHPYALYNLAVLLEDKYKDDEKRRKELSRVSSTSNISNTVTEAECDNDKDEDILPELNDKVARKVVSIRQSDNIKEKLNEVENLYRAAADADPKDASTAADCGRYVHFYLAVYSKIVDYITFFFQK